VASFLDSYQKITGFPGGQYLFNKLIGFKAPFFARIHPNVLELKSALSVVEMKDRRSIRNHIGSVNAGAMCTLAELSGGLALDAAIPHDLRWLPRGMAVAYLKKAKGTLIARCEFDLQIIHEGDIVIPLEIKDPGNDIVFTAEITFYISKKNK
jgi:acyl-coenzyme A thioesterase PaaI-like protein